MTHYDAFISYNHNPRDNKITRMLQKKLENYSLPKGISIPSGKNKIERVFLDKGELEVSGDLNVIIEEALENSDHLIVICSPESKQSIWVQREIEFFLKNHTVDDILTVITDGEPFDVLPDAVLFEEVEDDEGNIVKKAREPLSCDYRLPVRKADREELPRLMAALLGCRYDDLVQRQKQYRMRRQIALLASAAVLLSSAIGYLVWSNHRIRSNYEQSLIEESLNLAKQSAEALNRGDRIGAIRYALEALPSEDKDRPVVSEAVLALSDALDLYHSSQETRWTAVRQYESDVSCYEALPFLVDGKEYLAARFAGGIVKIYDPVSGEELMTDYTGELAESGIAIGMMLVSDSGKLLLISDKALYAVDVASEKEAYRLDLSIPSAEDYTVSTTYSSCCAGNDLWLITYNMFDYDAYYAAQEEASSSVNELDAIDFDFEWVEPAGPDRSLIRVDIEKGKVLQDITIGEDYPELLAVSEDGKYLAYVHEINSFAEDQLELIDVETGEKQTLTKGQITDMRFGDGGRLIICGCKERPSEYDYSTVTSSDYIRIGKEYTYPFVQYADRELFVTCLEMPSLNEVWNREYSGLYCGMPTFNPIYTNMIPSASISSIACTTGSNVMVLDSDGNIEQQAEFHSPVMMRTYNKENDTLRAILKDGSFAILETDTSKFTSYKNVFVDDIRNVISDPDAPSGSMYVLADNNADSAKRTLTQYVYRGTDSEWQKFDQEMTYEDMSGVQTELSYQDTFIEIRSTGGIFIGNEDDVARVISRNAGSGEVIFDITITVPDDARENSSFSFAGMDPEAGTLYFIDVIHAETPSVVTVDAATGETGYTLFSSSESASESDIYESIDFYISNAHSVSDLTDGKIYIPVDRSVSYEDDEAGGEWVDRDNVEIMELDIGAGTYSFTPVAEQASEEDPYYDAAFIIDADEKILVMAGSRCIKAYGFDGKLKWENAELPYTVQSMCFSGEGHILVTEQSEPSIFRLHVLDASKGKETAVTDLGLVSDETSEMYFASACEIVESGEILLKWDYDAFILDSSDWSLRSKIRYFISYNKETDSFILGDPTIMGNKEVGRVPYRTLEDMIAEGRAVTGE